jgi:hypothetical protein
MQNSSKSPQIFLWFETVCNSVNSPRDDTYAFSENRPILELESR